MRSRTRRRPHAIEVWQGWDDLTRPEDTDDLLTAPARPLILIPGVGSHHGSWLDFRLCLLTWEHLTPDLPGDDHASPPWTMHGTMEHVRAVVLAQTHAPLHLLGHSLGGMIALEWLEQYSEEVASVTAVNSSAARRMGGMVGRLRLRQWLRLLPGLYGGDEPDIDALVDLLVLSEDPVRRRWFIEQWEVGRLGSAPSARTLFHQFTAAFAWRPHIPAEHSSKVLLIVGTRDEFVPPNASQRLHRLLPESTLVALPGGHDLMRTHGVEIAQLSEAHAHRHEA